ncbi:hypothetical protein QJS10_CPA06g01116 [Acorus calamus]|uniref:Uncharacterized protein n=1 Tax=Acorus calamus TaxID=4465 RepID=A0AAV9EJC3_ACOCL|nr:hypothetical protein QJS10_CPA06g01116 [Acorus calamus]
MIRDFLWRDTPDKHTVHHVNWNSVCCPKEEGGLGIKRISDWNSAAAGSDPWIGGDGLRAHMGERLSLLFGPTKDTKVCKLINLGAWSKPRRWPATFDPLWTEIAEIEIGGQDIDELIWSPSKFGNLDMKEAWKEVRSRGGIAEWSD